ncbi:COG4223 family protein [Rhizobium sp. L1K21]|uniref:COG4223 family protein n=1 Tax=Rhizobium sp. L1K21 TaxID=2954933 RepID=UPI0020924406|nr:mitofilin family membrane protein [Rhizobium sp. L1K21]MCO6184870.1 mitofilin family membrane protein [Rhizobium sp. L1K21]
MPSDKTPRHSKSKDEPVTIELTASEVDDKENAASETTPETAAAANTGTDTESSVDTSAAADMTDDATNTAETEKPEAPEKKPEPAAAAAQTPPPARSGSLSGALAAGIFGGLVVLAGAGAAQYAGYIPNFGPQQTITDYGPAVSTLTERVEALENKEVPQVDLSPLQDRIQTLETQMKDLPLADLTDVKAMQGALNEATDKVAKAEDEIASLANRLVKLEEKVGEPRDDVEVARAIASAGLKAAIDRGGPFETELATLKTVAPDDPAVAELQPFAASGIPTRATLIKAFPDVADRMIAATQPADQSQSLTDRLMSSALSVIKVRPVGDVQGDSTEAIVARIEEKLQNGDLQAAATEWNNLPDAAKAAGEDFKNSLDARIKVEQLVSSTLSNAVTGTKN